MTDRDPMQRLWQAQTEENFPMSTQALQLRASRFRRRIQLRNLSEGLGAAFVVLAFGLIGLGADDGWTRAGCLAEILATVWVISKLFRDGRVGAPPPQATAASLLEFHRQQLVRQRDLANTVGRWYLAPFIPGILLLAIGRWQGEPPLGRSVEHDHQIIMLCCLIVGLALAIAWLVNKLGAARLEKQINELERLKRDEAV